MRYEKEISSGIIQINRQTTQKLASDFHHNRQENWFRRSYMKICSCRDILIKKSNHALPIFGVVDIRRVLNRNSDQILFPMALFAIFVGLRKIDSDSLRKIPAEMPKNEFRLN